MSSEFLTPKNLVKGGVMPRRRQTFGKPLAPTGQVKADVVPDRPHLDPFAAGQYLFASDDFVEFALTYPLGHMQLGHLCALKAAEVVMFVRKADVSAVQRFVSLYHGEAQIVEVPDETFLLLAQLIIVDPAGRAGFYTCYKTGFVFLDSFEASRIRNALITKM